MLIKHIIQPNGFGLVTLAAVLWGTIGVVTQAIYNTDSTTPLFINLGRMIIAMPILGAGAWHVMGRQMFNVPRRDLLLMLFSGMMLTTSQALYFEAIRYSGVTIPTLLTMCISPLLVALGAVALKFEQLSRQTVAALVCALIGSVLLVGVHPDAGADGENLAMGVVLSLITAIFYAGTILSGRFLAANYHPLQVTALNFLAGGALLVILNLASGVVTPQTADGWLLIVYLGLFPTALAYWVFQKGLRTVSATTASIISMLDPLVAAVLAWLLFGEMLSTMGMSGAALLIVSIFLLSAQSPKTA